jgi:thioredoxin reductase
VARLAADGAGAPFPPGFYPAVVVGSGPGGLQTSYALARLGIEHAVISQDEGPGGMFRRWPIYQRLLSWSKPDAPYEPGSREHEWYDHNSLIGDEPAHRALVAAQMSREFVVPSRSEMEQGLAAFAEVGGVRVRYGCRWQETRREADGFTLVTSDGEFRCRVAVFATGATAPWRSPIPGLEQVPHYVDTREKDWYRGKQVFVVGKRNSGFEIADGLAPWAKRVVLGSPSPVQASVIAVATVRARYLQPLEDASWGGGTFVLNATIDRVERIDRGWRVHSTGTTQPGALPPLEVDEVIAATGFCVPLLDLAELGAATVANGRIPALTPFWESVTLPGVFFAGNATQGAPGLRRHGVGSASATVSGFRYNARVLARHLAETHFGVATERPRLDPDAVVPYLLAELTCAPDLWSQKAYLARVVAIDPELGIRDEGTVPLEHFVDAPGPDSVAATVEMDEEGRIYPVVYRRHRSRVEERVLPPSHLHDYRDESYSRELTDFLSPFLGS